MSVEDEIKKAKEVYRKKKNPELKGVPERKQLAAPKQKSEFAEYLTIFFNIMKRDIIFKLGLQTRSDKKKETMKQEYNDFMEAHFNGRC
jgi:hypothetical protein